MENLYTKYVRHLRHFGEYVARLNAKLRELVEAAEWRDECLEAKDWCYRMKVEEWTPGGCKRWEKSYDHSIKILEPAEASYRAALKATKEIE